jgi:hypothetical protein
MTTLTRTIWPLLVILILGISKSQAANEDRYFVGPDRLTWTAGRAYCHKRGADLAVIETAEENEHVKRLVQQKSDSGAGCWIGATDAGHEGQWRWVNGKPLAPYSNWHHGEPNNLCHGENFAHMWPDGTWNDQKRDGSCNGWGLMQPVCERRERQVSRLDPAAAPLLQP